MKINLPQEASDIFYEVRELPTKDWECYWNNIFLPYKVKNKPLNYIVFAHEASKRLTPSSLQMTFNLSKLIIFYGPPGNGKSKLARGLANRVATILNMRNKLRIIYVELNGHKLSSRWLGGSPQLVQKAFTYVKEIAQQADIIFFMIDEVESLLTNRALTLSEANPVDVFRTVNAVLQEIDNLGQLNTSMFTIATSNLPKAIELAFLDRADLKIFIDSPSEEYRKLILKDTLDEFIKVFRAKVDPENCAKMLVPTTEGFSARQCRKILMEAIGSSTSLAINPSALTCSDMAAAATEIRERMEKDKMSNGVYEYTFKRADEVKNKEDERELADNLLLQKMMNDPQ
jgi:SpoVK/Ycf46/Vps4 family AAA+-type ATPase